MSNSNFVLSFYRPPSRYKTDFLNCSELPPDLNSFRIGSQDNSSHNQSNPFYAGVISNERITADDHFQDVRLVKFDITNSNMRYFICKINVKIKKSFINAGLSLKNPGT